MATPAQHKTAAETALAAVSANSTTTADFIAAQAHAHLASAVGTGTHYVAADAALTAYDAQRTGPTTSPALTREHQAREALLHAILAD